MRRSAKRGQGQSPRIIPARPGNGKDYLIVSETIPAEGRERDIALSSIRTELLSGKGPDAFICTYWGPGRGENEDGVFKFPNRAMENRMFLPLDDHISHAKYMEWDRLLPVVMAAGKGEEGQLILPLSYEFDVLLFDKDRYSSSVELPAGWVELAESGDKLAKPLANYATFYDMIVYHQQKTGRLITALLRLNSPTYRQTFFTFQPRSPE